MSTATEIMARLEAFEPILNKARAAVERVVENHIFRLLGREVSAKRAQKIRKRGDVVRFSHCTANGKARYRWLPRVEFKGCQ